MKYLIYLIGYIYMSTLMWMVDLCFVVYHLFLWGSKGFVSPPKFEKINEISSMDYHPDPIGGALNYNWWFKFQAIACNLSGDCDKFATAWKWYFHGKPVRYSIFPKDLRLINEAHVISVFNDKVYDLRYPRDMNLKEYFEKYYGDGWVVIRMIY